MKVKQFFRLWEIAVASITSFATVGLTERRFSAIPDTHAAVELHEPLLWRRSATKLSPLLVPQRYQSSPNNEVAFLAVAGRTLFRD
jgi:hypothetical protein